MKYVIIFVSLYLVSCSVGKQNYGQHVLIERNNALYLSNADGLNLTKVAEGKLAIDFFKKNVKPHDITLTENIYQHYLKNNLDSADAIFYIQDLVGGKNWIW